MKNLKFFTPKSMTAKRYLLSNLQFGLIGIVFFVAGCAASLAPKFDQGIVDNLSVTSAEVFQLLSEVSGGTSNNDYEKREEKYNTIIGKLEALQLQISARPLPKNKVIDAIVRSANERINESTLNKIVDRDTSLSSSMTFQISANEKAPSASALETIIKTLAKMKSTDKKQGITSTEAKLFKGAIVLSFDQALTYERFLNQ